MLLDRDGHLFLAVPFFPFVELRNSPEFASLMKWDRIKCPRRMASWVDITSNRLILHVTT